MIRGRRHLGAAALCGVVFALGQEPVSSVLLALLGLAAGLALMLAAPVPRQAGLVAWAFGTGYFLAALHWLVEPFLVDIARHGWMAPFAPLLMAGGLALFWAVAVLGAAVLSRNGARWRRALLYAAALTLAEMARARLLSGFPWAMIGSFWIETPVAQWAAVLGPHGLTLLSLLVVVPAAIAPLGGVLSAALVAGLWLAGPLALTPVPVLTADPPRLRLVQPNVPQHLKWREDLAPIFWERTLDLSAAPASGRPPDLVIWPEATLPYLMGTRPDLTAQAVAAAGGAGVIVGALRRVGGDLRNALAVIAPDATVAQIYDKFHLVPFGEYIPGGGLARALGLRGLAERLPGGFTPGPGPTVIDLSGFGAGRMLPLICYEAIFPRHARSAGPRPDWILQLTNDAWFGNFSGPQQHLAQARMRAIEQGLPLVRVANTGVSALIDANGRVLDRIALNVTGGLDVDLPLPGRPTIYSRSGDLPALLAALILAGLAVVGRCGRVIDLSRARR
ncbi:MAG: apolipoprotein N-acyltransferase [Qingshengfaniella sp.]